MSSVATPIIAELNVLAINISNSFCLYMHYDTVVQWASVMLALSPDKKPSVLHLNFVGMFVHDVDKQISSLAYKKNV